MAFLASPEAAYITGVTLRIDGGLILPGMPESGPCDGDGGFHAAVDPILGIGPLGAGGGDLDDAPPCAVPNHIDGGLILPGMPESGPCDSWGGQKKEAERDGN